MALKDTPFVTARPRFPPSNSKRGRNASPDSRREPRCEGRPAGGSPFAVLPARVCLALSKPLAVLLGKRNRSGHLAPRASVRAKLVEGQVWGLAKGPEGPWTRVRGQLRGRAHLAPGDVHEHREAGRVAALAGHVGPVPGQQLTALGRPASSPPGAAEKRDGSPLRRGCEGLLPPAALRHPPRTPHECPAVPRDRVNTRPPRRLGKAANEHL